MSSSVVVAAATANPHHHFPNNNSSIGQWIGQNFLFTSLLEHDHRVPWRNITTFTSSSSSSIPSPVVVVKMMMMMIYNIPRREEDKPEEEEDTTTTSSIKLGLLLPRVEFWLALAMTLLIGAIFSTCMSCIVYQFILLPRRRQQQQQKQQQYSRNKQQLHHQQQQHQQQHQNNKIISYHNNDDPSSLLLFSPYHLVGFGIVMPLCALSPYYIIRFFGIRNKIIKFLTGVAQLTSFFRCSEAMFGFLPPNVENSFSNLVLYTAFPIEIKFHPPNNNNNNNKNKKTKEGGGKGGGAFKSTMADIRYYLFHWIIYIVITGVYSSFLLVYNYQPYRNEEGYTLRDVKLGTGLAWKQLINNAFVAILFQIYLTTFGYGINFITSVIGFQQNPMMLNPLFESSSQSDFWGRRWNLTVHGILKRGVYKPFRTRYSRLTASVATFIASGLFHEWLLSIVFYPDFEDGSCSSTTCYLPGYGRNTLFFLWNAMIISLEYAIGGLAVFQLCRTHLPPTLVSLLVASTALPMAHWFTNDYVRSDFFLDAQIGFPMIVRVME